MTERLKDILANRKVLLSTLTITLGAKRLFIGYAVVAALLMAGTAAGMKDLIHFKYGEALMKAGHTERAAAEFLAAARTEGAGEELATMAHLHAARALEASNNRAEAAAQYRLVLLRPDAYDAHDEARKGLDDLTGGKRAS